MEDSKLRIKLGLIILGLICSTFYMYSVFQNMHRRVSVEEYYKRIFKPLKKNMYVYEAIDDNDFKSLKKLIEKDPEKANRANLRYAVENNRLEMTEYLILKGVNINYVPEATENAGTLLQYSIYYGKRESAKIIIKAGADVNLKVVDSESPLYLSVSKGWFDVTEMLIFRGAIIDADNKYEPLLHTAVEKNSEGIVKLLISKCPDTQKLVNAKGNYNNETPLHTAARTGNLKVAQILIENGADIDAKDDYGVTPLDLSIDEGHKEFAKYLIDKGADLYPVTLVQGVRSPVLTAVMENDIATLKLLLQKGAIPDTRDRWNRTPLYYALYDNNPEISTLLMSAGVCLTEAERRDRELIGKILGKNCSKTVSLFLKNGFNPNLRNKEDGDYLIHLAVKNPEALEALIMAGAKVNVRNKIGRTPLFIAMGSCNVRSANILLKHGAKKFTTDNNGKTPLHFAAWNLNFRAVQYLFLNGLKVNAQDNEGHTPLFWVNRSDLQDYSGERARERTVELLVALGGIDDSATTKRKKNTASVSNKSKLLTSTELIMTNNKREFLYAILRDNPETVKQLLHRCPGLINVRIEDGNTPLHYACSKGSYKTVLYLLDLGVDINAKNNMGERPIHNAVTEVYERTLRILLERGADINAKDNYGETPLHKASCRGYLNILNILIQNGADINAVDNSGETPIYNACYFREEQALKLLIKEGADVNAKSTCSDKKPIHKAVWSGNPRIVKILIDAGADLNVCDENGNTPLHQAILYEGTYYRNVNLQSMRIIAEMLISKGNTLNTPNKSRNFPLHSAISLQKNRIVRRLLAKGVWTDSIDNYGRTPLNIAIVKGNIDAIYYLIEFGADVKKLHKSGEMPIHGAALRGNEKAIDILLHHGANIESRDDKGRTPLHCLADREYREYRRGEGNDYYYYQRESDGKIFHGYEQSARLLLKKGAKINARDKVGKTPLYYARSYGYMETAKIFEEYGGKE